MFLLKVVLLGRYNAQGLGSHTERITRTVTINKGKKLIVEIEFITFMISQLLDGIDKKDSSQFSNLDVRSSCINDSTGVNKASSSSWIEIWIRVTPKQEYIKLIVQCNQTVVNSNSTSDAIVANSKYIIGALLIGDTELEEVFENLIMNKLNINSFGVDLLDPDVDIADYFD